MSFTGRILVVGGGIGGLAVARGLVAQGGEVVIVERTKGFAPAGAGIVLAANAVAVLDALDIDIARHGRALPGMRIADHRGTTLQAARTDELQAGYQAIYALHRADLHNALLVGAAGASIRMDTTVLDLEDDGQAVDVSFGDGATERFDLVIGADGLHSTVRSLVYRVDAPGSVYSGYTCWRFVAPWAEPLDGAVEMFGRGDRAGVVPLTDDRAYVFLVADAPEDGPAASWSDLEARFHRFPSLVSRLIRSAGESGAPLLHHDLRDAERIVWGRGRVWLLGDAAHAPLPNLGQGAAMALEDALALSRALETGNDVATAFERYVQVRHRRTSAIWRDSRRLGWIAQWSGPVATRIRNALFAWTPSSVGRRQLEAIVRPGVELARAQGSL
jgi:2-polyprenyl-6-methoxyphenol hydroxylase-like FAD-dependent oxidoreductase